MPELPTWRFFARWPKSVCDQIVKHGRVIKLASGDELMPLGAVPGFDFFLISGSLQLKSSDGNVRIIEAGSVEAGYPVAHLRPARYWVNAVGAARILRVERAVLRQVTAELSKADFRIDEVRRGPWRNHPLVMDVYRAQQEGRLQLPAMPAIANRVQQMLATEDVDMNRVAALISADPGIAGKLVNLANSAMYPGTCDSVQGALVRLGIESVRNAVLAFAAREAYSLSLPGRWKSRLASHWRRCVDVAALCAVLARRCNGFDPNRAMLIGLIHESGMVPALALAAKHPDLLTDSEELDAVLAGLVPELSARIITTWDLPLDFAEAAEKASSWYRDDTQTPDYVDLLLVARLHYLVKQKAQRSESMGDFPRLDELPAFGRLAPGNLSPALSLEILEESTDQLRALKSLLG